MKTVKLLPLLLTTLLALPAFAQSVANEVQRDTHQQQRIENGLQSGQLTTREAAKLEKETAHVDRAQANALKDGVLTQAEKTRVQNMQNKVSHDIATEKHDAQTGNPNSVSSKRMQADVQHNIHQEKRIQAGINNGSLTNHEVAKLEKKEAVINHKQYRAGRDGHVNSREQQRIARAEHRQARRIHHEKHDHNERAG